MKPAAADLLGTRSARSASRFAAATRSLRALTLLVLVVLVAGCGNVEWFPEYVRQPTTPNQFTFANKTGTGFDVTVTSDPITVSGLTADSSPITVTGPTGADSKYTINSGTPTSAAGTVKNGDQVTVSHKTAASTLEGTTTSTLNIGGVSGTFTSFTRLLDFRSLLAATTVGNYRQTSGTVFSIDRESHVVSVKDSIGSGNAQFSIADDNGNATTFGSAQLNVLGLNGRKIFVRNLATTVATPATTILTIDGVDYEVPLAVQ